MYMATKK